jgi:hypothetical protein
VSTSGAAGSRTLVRCCSGNQPLQRWNSAPAQHYTVVVTATDNVTKAQTMINLTLTVEQRNPLVSSYRCSNVCQRHFGAIELAADPLYRQSYTRFAGTGLPQQDVFGNLVVALSERAPLWRIHA